MKPYADTNFFSRYYLGLGRTAVDLALADRAETPDEPPLPVTWLLRVELANALQLLVFQARQPVHVRVTPEQAAIANAAFREDLELGEFLRPVGLSLERLTAQCEELSLRHTASHGCRTYDLLHVASALLLGCDCFWSFDPKAQALAAREGLAVPPVFRPAS